MRTDDGAMPMLFVLGLMVLVIIAVVYRDGQRKGECEAKGGVYFSRESQCMKGERIPLGGAQ